MYIGAVCETAAGTRAVINTNSLDDRAAFIRQAAPSITTVKQPKTGFHAELPIGHPRPSPPLRSVSRSGPRDAHYGVVAAANDPHSILVGGRRTPLRVNKRRIAPCRDRHPERDRRFPNGLLIGAVVIAKPARDEERSRPARSLSAALRH
jgi:hypothetical protein